MCNNIKVESNQTIRGYIVEGEDAMFKTTDKAWKVVVYDQNALCIWCVYVCCTTFLFIGHIFLLSCPISRDAFDSKNPVSTLQHKLNFIEMRNLDSSHVSCSGNIIDVMRWCYATQRDLFTKL